MKNTALLLIAHGSRRVEANQDLEHLAEVIRSRGVFTDVQPSYLELASPSIIEGGTLCVQRGAEQVIMLPYFLAAGVHARDDMREAREQLAATFPCVRFLLAEPLGRHPFLAEIVLQRAAEADPELYKSDRAMPDPLHLEEQSGS